MLQQDLGGGNTRQGANDRKLAQLTGPWALTRQTRYLKVCCWKIPKSKIELRTTSHDRCHQ
jgi:hypothetical protein